MNATNTPPVVLLNRHLSAGPDDPAVRDEIAHQSALGVVEAQRYCSETAKSAAAHPDTWALRIAAACLGSDSVLRERMAIDAASIGVDVSALLVQVR